MILLIAMVYILGLSATPIFVARTMFNTIQRDVVAGDIAMILLCGAVWPIALPTIAGAEVFRLYGEYKDKKRRHA